MEQSQQWVLLARILRPQGRRGEVLADLFTDFPARFAERPHVWLAPAGFAEASTRQANSAVPQPKEIISHWLPVGRNSGRVVLHFAGVDSISAAAALAGKEVVVPLADRAPLDDDSVYIADLIGCTVYDRQAVLGAVEEVQFPSTSDGSRRLEDAAPLLAVHTKDGEELLVPFVKSYLVSVNTAAKAIRMNLPEGLAELNRTQEPNE